MKRHQLEHIIRASADLADDDEIIVIGSQSVLAQFPDAPAVLLVSNEADVFPKNHPERWELIDGSIGEGSPFHDTFGYYAQGVEEGTAVLPAGWKDRLVPIRNANTRGAAGLCLEIHDLALSKYVAGRDKDRVFLRAAVQHGLLDRATLLARVPAVALGPAQQARLLDLIAADFANLPPSP
ncbi:MAG: hypothetical protein IT370_01345 [Deltaproteobacteria bacterium]|nr:hypothetical protein [Deltaproteobacteria bacterium]